MTSSYNNSSSSRMRLHKSALLLLPMLLMSQLQHQLRLLHITSHQCSNNLVVPGIPAPPSLWDSRSSRQMMHLQMMRCQPLHTPLLLLRCHTLSSSSGRLASSSSQWGSSSNTPSSHSGVSCPQPSSHLPVQLLAGVLRYLGLWVVLLAVAAAPSLLLQVLTTQPLHPGLSSFCLLLLRRVCYQPCSCPRA